LLFFLGLKKRQKTEKNQKSKKGVLLFKVASQLLFYTRTKCFLQNIALKY
jgi:hypothetical protein